MDGKRFDEMTRMLSTPRQRRSVIKGLAAVATGVAAARLSPVSAAKPERITICFATGEPNNPVKSKNIDASDLNIYVQQYTAVWEVSSPSECNGPTAQHCTTNADCPLSQVCILCNGPAHCEYPATLDCQQKCGVTEICCNGGCVPA